MIHRLVFSRRGALLAALASVAAAGFAVPAAAAAPVTSLTSCQIVNTPGTYRLDADIKVVVARICFFMTKDVMLILNGHTITNIGFTGAGITTDGSGDTIVGPGTVSGWQNGINLAGGSGSVRGVTVTNNAGPGIFIPTAGNSVRGNVATDNFEGIEAKGSGNTIIGNYAHGNTRGDLIDSSGICTSNVWRGNDFRTASPSCIR
jgi:parallel beta-helix repeat protein